MAKFKKGSYRFSAIAAALLIVLSVLALTNAEGKDEPAGLVGYWKFDGDAKDSSPRGNHGDPIGVEFVEGKFGRAARFDAAKETYIDLGHYTGFDVNYTNQPVTMAAWVKGGPGVIFSDNTATGYYCFAVSQGKACLWYTKRDWKIHNKLFSSKTINDNKFHHVVGIIDGYKFSLYIDGVFDIANTFSLPKLTWSGTTSHGSSGVSIGAKGFKRPGGNPEWGFLDGTIDELRIYNRVLSELDIEQLHKATAYVEKQSLDPPTLPSRTEDGCYFAEDFERHNEGSLPEQWIVVYNGRGHKAQGIRAQSGNKYLRVAGRQGWSCVLRHEFAQPMPSKVSFSFRLRTLSGIGVIGIGNGTKCIGYSMEGLEIRDDRWHDILFIVDFDAGVASYFIDYKPTHQDVPLHIQDPKSQWTYWDNRPAIAFDSDNKVQGEIQVDDIKIYDLETLSIKPHKETDVQIEIESPVDLVRHWNFGGNAKDTVSGNRQSQWQECRYPSWSNDGQYVFFAGKKNDTYDLWRMRQDGTDLKRISDYPPGRHVWGLSSRPNSDDIYYLDTSLSGLDFHWIVKTPAAKWQRTPLIMVPGGDGFSGPSFSPDGSRFCFNHQTRSKTGERYGRSIIKIANADGSDVRSVMEYEGKLGWIAWGRGEYSGKIVYTKPVDGVRSVFMINTDRSNEVQITQKEQGDFGPASFSPDGKWLVSYGEDVNICILKPDGSNYHKMNEATVGGLNYAFSPDGTKIAYATKSNDRHNIKVLALKNIYLRPGLKTDVEIETERAVEQAGDPQGAANIDNRFSR